MELYKKIGFIPTALLIVLLVGLFKINFGEKILVGNGAGFDGVYYAFVVQNFEDQIQNRKVNTSWAEGQPAKIDRFFPAMLVHYGMKAFDVTVSDYKAVVKAFEYHNLVWLLLGTLTWGLLAIKLKLKESSKWLGFVFFFASVAIQQVCFYDPVLTDTAAYVMALMLLAFFLYNHAIVTPLGIVFIAIMAGFTWQPITIYAYFLLAFPRKTSIISENNPYLNWAVWILPVFVTIYAFFGIYDGTAGIDKLNAATHPEYGEIPFHAPSLMFSFIMVCVFSFFYYKYLYQNFSWKNFWYFIKPSTDNNFDVKEILLYNIPRILSIGTIYFTVKYFHNLVSPLPNALASTASATGQQAANVTNDIVANTVTGLINSPLNGIATLSFNVFSLHLPLEFIIMFAVYFGVFFIIAIVYFPQFAKMVRTEGGLGVLLVFLASVNTALQNPQSRVGTALVPFVLVFVVMVIDKENWKEKFIYILIGLSVFASKFWYIIGNEWQLPNGQFGPAWDGFFMNIGTQAPLKFYPVHALAFLAILIYFWVNKKNLSQNTPEIVPEIAPVELKNSTKNKKKK